MLGCVIMAAGNAVRFGANKLEAELDGKPLIRRAFEAVPAGVFDRVVVVTQYPAVAALAREFGFEPVRNDRPGDGLSRTVRLGTQALAQCDGIAFLVADQPLLSASAVRAVVRQWRPAARGGAIRTCSRGNFSRPCARSRETAAAAPSSGCIRSATLPSTSRRRRWPMSIPPRLCALCERKSRGGDSRVRRGTHDWYRPSLKW